MVGIPSPGDNLPLSLGQQLAEEIRKRRKAAGLSQPALAALIGYTRQYVSRAERPKRGLPSAQLVEAIDDALGAGGSLVALRQQAYAQQKACRSGASCSNAAAVAGKAGRAAGEDPAIVNQGILLVKGPSSGSSDGVERRELLRLLSMAGVLVMAPGIDDELDPDRLVYSSNNASRLDGVAVDEYATLNIHLWRTFVLSRFKGAALPLVYSQLEVLTASLDQSQESSTHSSTSGS